MQRQRAKAEKQRLLDEAKAKEAARLKVGKGSRSYVCFVFHLPLFFSTNLMRIHLCRPQIVLGFLLCLPVSIILSQTHFIHFPPNKQVKAKSGQSSPRSASLSTGGSFFNNSAQRSSPPSSPSPSTSKKIASSTAAGAAAAGAKAGASGGAAAVGSSPLASSNLLGGLNVGPSFGLGGGFSLALDSMSSMSQVGECVY